MTAVAIQGALFGEPEPYRPPARAARPAWPPRAPEPEPVVHHRGQLAAVAPSGAVPVPCRRCRRKLTDPASIAAGIGPVCAAKEAAAPPEQPAQLAGDDPADEPGRPRAHFVDTSAGRGVIVYAVDAEPSGEYL